LGSRAARIQRPAASAWSHSPRRANLIGEHTDYNRGLSLPFAIEQGVMVRGERRDGDEVLTGALDEGQAERFPVTGGTASAGGDWTDFVRGTLGQLSAAGFALRGASLEISGVPEPGDRVALARVCSRVEQEWVGAPWQAWLLLVPAGEELAFLHPLPIERLWGVGRVTSRKLRDRGITTVGAIARCSEDDLVAIVGRAAGHQLHALSRNRDPRSVQVRRRRRSIGSQDAVGRGRKSPAEIDAVLGLVDRVTRRRTRRAHRRPAAALGRLQRATRSHTLTQATAHTGPVLATVRGLLAATMPIIERRGLTLVGIAVANLSSDAAVQLALPLDRHRGAALDAAIDDVRKKFGAGVLTRAVLLGRDPGLTVPMLPD
jgi:hypothetical protein